MMMMKNNLLLSISLQQNCDTLHLFEFVFDFDDHNEEDNNEDDDYDDDDKDDDDNNIDDEEV